MGKKRVRNKGKEKNKELSDKIKKGTKVLCMRKTGNNKERGKHKSEARHPETVFFALPPERYIHRSSSGSSKAVDARGETGREAGSWKAYARKRPDRGAKTQRPHRQEELWRHGTLEENAHTVVGW